MRTFLRLLTINKFVVHDIPNKFPKRVLKENPEQTNQEPELSDIETPFSPELQSFFYKKISESIGSSNSFDIEYINDNVIVPIEVERFFDNPDIIVDASQNIAKHLYDTQNAKNSGGLLLFIVCHIGTNNALAILKVEREEGVQIQKEMTSDGHKHFNLAHIGDLMLTKKTKLFKAVLFYKEVAITRGILSDQQMGYNIGKDVADYFLTNFLGCKLKNDPSLQTKKFFETTQEFINNSEMSAEEKNATVIHLVSNLTNNSGTINPQQFAENCLGVQYADNFLAVLNENGVGHNSFVKNTTLISNKLSQSEYIFLSGIKVSAPKEEIENHLSLSSLEGGRTKMEIIDSLMKVSSK